MQSYFSGRLSCNLAGRLIVLFSIGPLAAQVTPDRATKRIKGTSYPRTGRTSGVEFKVAVRAASSIGAGNRSSYAIGMPD